MSNTTVKSGTPLSVRQAKAFKRLRQEAQLRQEDVAEKLGINRTTIVGWERGKWLPRPETIVELANLYHCSTDDLLNPKDV